MITLLLALAVLQHSPWPQRRCDQLSAMDWLREARYWLRVAHQLP